MKPVRCWLRSHWWAPIVLVVLAAIVVWAVWSSVSLVDAKNRSDANRARLRAESEQSRRYLCEKTNQLPGKINELLVVGDQIRQLIGPTTTLPPRPDLDPEELRRLAQLRAQQERLVRDLGKQDDCEAVVAGRVTSDTTRP